MCDPLTITGLALTAGGAGANYMGQRRAQAATDAAVAAERGRQRGYDAEAAGVNERMRGRYEDASGQTAAKSAELGDYFTGASPVEAATAMPASSEAVTAEIGKQRAAAEGRVTQQGRALGELRAFGDVLGGIGRGQQRDLGTLSTISGFKKGSQNVLPLEADAASRKGDGFKLFGDILKGAGGVATGAGLSGRFGGAAAAAPGLPANNAPYWLGTATPTAAAPAAGWSPVAGAGWPAAGRTAAAPYLNGAGNPFRLY